MFTGGEIERRKHFGNYLILLDKPIRVIYSTVGGG
jgi:hypothetical protein